MDLVAPQQKPPEQAFNEAHRAGQCLEQTREDLGEAEEKLKSTEQTLQSVQSSLAEDQAALQEARGLLERYQPIIDVEGEAASLKEEAAAALAEAKSKLADATRRAESTLQDAYGRAELIEKEARAKAEEIAGDAFLAQGRVKEYEKALQALKNAVDGYGDEYIKPSETVLDDLAEHFGFAEAGEKYKEAKARTKAMIKQGTAAECDYVEEYRRKTAVAFVIDAFNGKTDSTLARVKTDNLGKLQQEIEDAFALVNLNGQAFRNARITPAYRDARLEELRWAVALVVLREKEREEQRAIRERIREEEKARREYEKAMREAARDEERLQTAMEKARNELAKAKSQRAISMAQQTRSGHVYIISNVGSFGLATQQGEPPQGILPSQFGRHPRRYAGDGPDRPIHHAGPGAGIPGVPGHGQAAQGGTGAPDARPAGQGGRSGRRIAFGQACGPDKKRRQVREHPPPWEPSAIGWIAPFGPAGVAHPAGLFFEGDKKMHKKCIKT